MARPFLRKFLATAAAQCARMPTSYCSPPHQTKTFTKGLELFHGTSATLAVAACLLASAWPS